MSFQSYLTNIEAQTGQSPDDFRRLADARGWMADNLLKPTVKAGEVITWLKADFTLGHGHAMAIVAMLKGKTE